MINIDKIKKEDIEFLQSVIVFNCGGTINMIGDKERKPSSQISNIIVNVENQLKKNNTLVKHYNIFERAPDSSNIGEDEWIKIYYKIVEVICKKKEIELELLKLGIIIEKGGIIVTHGTDTLQISGFILSLLLSSTELNFPIIFTASHSPISEKNSDGIRNFLKSVHCAKECFSNKLNTLPPGIYVLIGRNIHLASRLSKVYTTPNSEDEYFFSFPAPVGKITGKEYFLKINQEYISNLFSKTSSKIIVLAKFGYVEHLVLDSFCSLQKIEDLVRRINFYKSSTTHHNKKFGVIIQGNFSGNINIFGIIKRLRDLHNNGVVIFVGSKDICKYEQENFNEQVLNLIHKSLSHSRAREKLSFLLGQNIPLNDVIKQMNSNLVGEIYASIELPEWINYETFPPIQDGQDVLIIYPNIHEKVFIDTINFIKKSKNAKKALYIYGFGDGHIPSPNRSIEKIVLDYLQSENIIDQYENSILNRNINELTDFVTDRLIVKNVDFMISYLKIKYKYNKELLKKAIIRKFQENSINNCKDLIKDNLIKFVKEINVSGFEIKIKDKNKLLKDFLNNTKISHDYLEFTKVINELLINENFIFENIVKNFPSLISKKLIADAIASCNVTFHEIYFAIEEGVDVYIKTSASKSKTNTDLYENGNMLKILGVKSDNSDGWDTRFFSKKE